MTEFKKFPSIEQFRHTVRAVKKHCEYNELKLPTIEFKGTVKLHGTNAAIGYDPVANEVFVQSRKNIITPENDNYGFAAFVEERKSKISKDMWLAFGNGTETEHVFGEFCGGNIQGGVGVSGLEKMFVIFDADPFVTQSMCIRHENIHSINDFTTFKCEIDFNNPEFSIEKLQKITEQVEAECPVAKHFGVDNGVGEGVVWNAEFEGMHLSFKVKGEKHSSSKVKKLASVDVEKVNSINEFVEKTVTENRLNQGVEVVFTMNNESPDIKKMGDFIRWVFNDVLKEEVDTLTENGLSKKDIGSKVSLAARDWFKSYLDKNL
jgi:hypothetical protein